jgi:hypothetical protein
MNWRGGPLTSHDVIVQSIAATTTRSGLTVHGELDTNEYATGITIPDHHMKTSKRAAPSPDTTGTGNGTTPSPRHTQVNSPDRATSGQSRFGGCWLGVSAWRLRTDRGALTCVLDLSSWCLCTSGGPLAARSRSRYRPSFPPVRNAGDGARRVGGVLRAHFGAGWSLTIRSMQIPRSTSRGHCWFPTVRGKPETPGAEGAPARRPPEAHRKPTSWPPTPSPARASPRNDCALNGAS